MSLDPYPKGQFVSQLIMTVDDLPSMRMLLRAALTDMGYRVLEAEDGVHALDTLDGVTADTAPDLVITDINMPRMDGFGLIEALRRQPDRRNLPILVLTTESSDEKKARAREAGATGWIVKPFNPESSPRPSAACCTDPSGEEPTMSRQLITFQLGDQILGVDIMAIREIRAWSPATPLPNVPAHVRGVVNLRGVVLPVLDLRHRLGWGVTDPSARHVIIVVRIGEQLQGLIVDAVNDIVTIPPEAMQPLPDMGEATAAHYLEGLATIEQRLILILALDRLSDSVTLTAEAA